ncbi:MAG: TetR/AcrR family transcriptional regulator [Oceanospirillaceae bacterium]|jgi:AcrR family transcriptional regulator|nr:TetR/AcrR family transcriptional regulator [Oceanospirillaceae bacterium]MBT4442730.1 TetR/AcrR family transcriptional regulator [Oceanospirillaceae bacterium]MBT6078015.1 TetR/AcrR family transcriptional regulator [Oceanospirillaceae bacterium]MBT7331016.1 TetR/AcrR family transcriptional regulator [Oceanospirillaceae bacterium]
MSRPSVKAEKKTAIMSAFVRCIAKRGLDATSLDDIAQESGISRSLVRHFAGNREDLVNQVADYVAYEFETIWRQQEQAHRSDSSDDWLATVLFTTDPEGDYKAMLPAFYALLSAAHRYPRVSERMTQCFEIYVADLTEELQQRHPKAGLDACQQVALGVISIYFAWDGFRGLALAQAMQRNNQKLVTRLLATLN